MFITLEGGEAAGKSTQMHLLADSLSLEGFDVLTTREPGGAPGAEKLRDILLYGEHRWSPAAEAYLHFAARAEHLDRTIMPALAAGTLVVCDRFADSTLAYQGYGQGADRTLIEGLTRLLPIQPDLSLVLQVSPGRAAERLGQRDRQPDRYEGQDAAFHARVAAGFAAIAAANPARCVMIDADGSIEAVHDAIVEAGAGAAPGVTPRENPALFGHAAADSVFAEAVASGRVHHAWLLTGPPGVGKATLAFRMARRLLTQAGEAHDPANPVFRRLARGTHADVLTLEREMDEKRRRMKTEIAVDQVRAVTGFMHLTPAEGGWRVVIVDGAEDMNRNAANALLKVLEEPPRRAILLLTADAPGRLLPTIRSRCRRLKLDPLEPAEMDAALTALLPDTSGEVRAGLAAVANGAPGRAVALAEDGALALAALARDVLAAPRIPITRMYEVADQVNRSDTGFSTFMTLLRRDLSDAVRTAARGRPNGVAARRPLAEWGEVWHALGRLQEETERSFLDKRTAVVAGLEML